MQKDYVQVCFRFPESSVCGVTCITISATGELKELKQIKIALIQNYRISTNRHSGMYHSDNLQHQTISQKYVLFAILCQCTIITLDNPLILYIMSGVEGFSTEAEIKLELHKCSAYEIVKLSRRRVEMETNPAYGEVGQLHRDL